MVQLVFTAALVILSVVSTPAVAEEPSWLLSIDTPGTVKHIGDQINIYVTQTNVSTSALRIGPFPNLDCPISVLDSHNVSVSLTEQTKASNAAPHFTGRPGPDIMPGGVHKFIFNLGSYIKLDHPGLYSVQFSIWDPNGGGARSCLSSNVIHFTIS